MLFVENVGQISGDVVYYTMHPSVVYVLRDGTIYINGARITFHSRPRRISGNMPLMTRISYFGRNREVSDIPTFRRVVMEDIYPNIDAVLTADGRGVVEIQFLVHPGGDPSRIIVETDGYLKEESDGIYLVKEGKEVAKLTHLKGYQGAEEVYVEADVNGKELRFRVDGWDGRHALVIDPIVAAIIASSGMESTYSIVVNNDGGVLIAGETFHSSDFAPDREYFGASGGNSDAFITMLSNDLSTHIATAILTSSGGDGAFSLSIDGSGNVLVAGYTENSANFAPSRTIFGTTGYIDAFITRLSSDLQGHIATAILASSGWDYAESVIVDDSGNVLVAGYTGNSGDFAPDRLIFGTPGNSDVFVSRLSGDLSTHMATAIMGSSESDLCYSVVMDGDGNIFIAGDTDHWSNFAPNRILFGTPGYGSDVFVSKLSGDLQSHIATVILASSLMDGAYTLSVDDSGNVLVAGITYNSSDFAPDRTVFGTPGTPYDTAAFVSRLSNDLQNHIATAILTSSGSDGAYGLAIDTFGNILVAGETRNSSNFAPDRIVYGTAGSMDVFVSKLTADLGSHIATAIITSSEADYVGSMDIDNSGKIFITGITFNYSDFAPSRYVFGTPGGLMDAYVARLPQSLNSFEKLGSGEVYRIAYHGGVLKVNLGESAYVGMDIYDLSGRLLKRMTYGYLPAGQYRYRLNLAKGAYILRVRIGEKIESLKIVM